MRMTPVDGTDTATIKDASARWCRSRSQRSQEGTQMNRTHYSIRRMLALTALAVALSTGVATTAANAQPATGRGVTVDYAKLDALGIDRTAVDLAVAALVR